MRCSARASSLALTIALLLPACEDASNGIGRRSEVEPPRATDGGNFTRAGLTNALAALRKRLGDPVNSLRLEVLPDRVVVQAQDPVHPSRVEQYEYHAGAVSEPVAVELAGPGTLEPNLFPLREVPIEAVESMVREAIARVDSSDGVPLRIVARRGLPQTPNVRIRIFVGSPGFDGHADFDRNGKAL